MRKTKMKDSGVIVIHLVSVDENPLPKRGQEANGRYRQWKVVWGKKEYVFAINADTKELTLVRSNLL